MKGLKITNIILFTIICILEAAMIALFAVCIANFFSNNIGSVLVSILIYFPYFLMGSFILLIFSIAITVTTRIKVNKEFEQNLTKTKFDRLCILLPWLFIVLNVVLFIAFYVISAVSSHK